MKFKPLSTPGLTKEQFETEMALVPRHRFFPTIEQFVDNVNKRAGLLRELEKASLKSGAFEMSEEFREDFLSRND